MKLDTVLMTSAGTDPEAMRIDAMRALSRLAGDRPLGRVRFRGAMDGLLDGSMLSELGLERQRWTARA
jgi:hypothetical protein